jgi:hypothetical protein
LAQSLKPATIWTSGHWGWQWYATQNGLREVDVHSSVLRPGDYFVVPDDVDHQPLEAPPAMRLVRTDTQERSLLNVICTGRTVRFYASDFGTAPWSLTRNCINRITVFEIENDK